MSMDVEDNQGIEMADIANGEIMTDDDNQGIDMEELIAHEGIRADIPEIIGGVEIVAESKCCIYKVPELFRKESEESYRPSVVSIGPAYYKDKRLESMQELKRKFLDKFLQDTNQDLRFYTDEIRALNQEIRSCYEETLLIRTDGVRESNQDNDDFIEMVVRDAVFLLCFFKSQADDYYPLPSNVRHPNNLAVLMLLAKRDVFLEENQLPFFVLHKIYDLAFPNEQPSAVIRLACKFIAASSVFPGFVEEEYTFRTMIANVNPSMIAHLIDLWRMGFSSSVKLEYKVKDFDFPKTAKQLSAAGVKFKKSENDLNPLSVKFNQKKGELQIPPFVVDTRTEAFLRNALIFEHCHYFSQRKPYFINLFFFLDSLIDSAEDIQLLTESGILKNLLGSEERAANFFNDITKYLDIVNIDYDLTYVSQEVNAYANKRYNKYMAILRRKYFSHPWSIISVIFAILVFILTLLQTIFTIGNK